MNRVDHDGRPSVVQARKFKPEPGRVQFDTFMYVPGTYSTVGEPWRLRVWYDSDHGLVEISDERATSENVTAETVPDEHNQIVQLTDEQLIWLHGALGKLIVKMGERS